MNAKVSVIIPCYNADKYIENCLESVVNQTIGMENLEIILVDDASTDNTISILKDYELKYPEQIMLILCEKNGKQGTARNIGMQYATGDWISFVDADDWIRRDMYECLLKMAEDTESELVQFRYKFYRSETEDAALGEVEYVAYDLNDVIQRKECIINDDVLDQSCTTKLYHRSLLERTGSWYAEGVIYEEPLFTFPFKFTAKRICVTEYAFYYYRYNNEGTCLKDMGRVNAITDHIKVHLDTFDFIRSKTYFPIYRLETEFYTVHTIFVETCYLIKVRKMNMPLDLFLFVKQLIKRIIPDYRNNPYLQGEMYRRIFELADDNEMISDEAKLNKQLIDIFKL